MKYKDDFKKANIDADMIDLIHRHELCVRSIYGYDIRCKGECSLSSNDGICPLWDDNVPENKRKYGLEYYDYT